jgi:HD-GYP domain-containing protein (c-di-GMP phosphodiesterase class II)
MSKEKALEELEKCAGTQFDPEIVKVFIENEVASEELGGSLRKGQENDLL